MRTHLIFHRRHSLQFNEYKYIYLYLQGSSSKAAKVRKFVILPTEFSIAGGELGPTMKIKRHVVESKYAKEIEHMYTQDDRTSLWDA